MVKSLYDMVKHFYQLVNGRFPTNDRPNGYEGTSGGGGGARNIQPAAAKTLSGPTKEDTPRVGCGWFRRQLPLLGHQHLSLSSGGRASPDRTSRAYAHHQAGVALLHQPT